VPVTFTDLRSRFLLALPAALLLIALSGCQAIPPSRSFQMTVWAEQDKAPAVDTDIPTFYDGAPQPAGRAILIKSDLNKRISAGDYAWSRIDAVLFDEPYNDFNSLPNGCWPAAATASVNARIQLLGERAAEVKSVAPSTRFWVNLAKPQMDWATSSKCSDQSAAPIYVNRPYIDIISVDIYYKSFADGLQRYYRWLETHRSKPEQQLALIPGTFYREGVDDPATPASYLRGYFDYASKANRRCDLPLGERATTGSFDGCRVWIVLGWLAHTHSEGGISYIGVRSPTAAPITNAWRTQLDMPLRPGLATPIP